jgi:hypothetical protein
MVKIRTRIIFAVYNLLEIFCIVSLASPYACSNNDAANVLVTARKYRLLVQTLRRPYVASYIDPVLPNTFIKLMLLHKF